MDDLKRQIYELIENTDTRDLQGLREVIFDFIAGLLGERDRPLKLTPKDLTEIRSTATTQIYNLPAPCYLDGKIITDSQRSTYCYIKAINLFLRSAGHRHYVLEQETGNPLRISVFED